MYSLYIGRFQPFHKGHQTMIQKMIDEGKEVCIAIRDTEISEKNPYNSLERYEMVRHKFPYIKIIVIPDIEEVVYGRDVGYGIRELRLDAETESISGTKIRNGDLDNR
jgi:adenylylsulfate kinase